MSFRAAALTVATLATAMAYLEGAVVVYLQHALGVTPADLFPLQDPSAVGSFAAIEVGREFATLVMLVAVGCLAGRRWLDRLAWTAVAFGVWDLLYYFWLWVFMGWPPSLDTWDLLFLIPVPWAAPVWAPMLVSLALVLGGLAAAYEVRRGHPPHVGPWHASGGVLGGALVVLSFTEDAPNLMAGGIPGWFAWPVFAAGIALAGLAAVHSLRPVNSTP